MEEHRKPQDGTTDRIHLEAVDAAGINLAGFTVHLQDLLVENAGVQEFLEDMAKVTAAELSGEGNALSCGVTVIRQKRPVAVAASDAEARNLDDLQNSFGDGPCLSALRTATVVHVPDVYGEDRWPRYMRAAANAGVGSILALPLELDKAGEAVVNLYSRRAHGFSHENILAAESITATASKALRLGLKIAQLSDARNDLKAALESRTTIDTAIGAIMAQNRCGRDAAFKILVTTSSHRNIRLRTLAEDILQGVSGEREMKTVFED